MGRLSPRDKIFSAKLALRQGHPFFSYLASQLTITEDVQTQTASIAPDFTMRYNPTFVLNMSTMETVFVVAHEIGHIILGHLTSYSTICKINTKKANMAMDLKVNDMLLVEKVGKAPKFGMIPTTVHSYTFQTSQKTVSDIDKKSTLEIFNEIDDIDVPNEPQPDQHEHQQSQDKADEQQSKIEDKIAEASMASQDQGITSEDLKRLVGAILKPKANYKEKLLRFVQAIVPTFQTWVTPNKRMLAQGRLFPGLRKETINGCIHYDTSGSISDKILQEFNSQVKVIINTFPSIQLHILVGDSSLCYEKDIDNNTNLDEEVKMAGGGGTSHKFVFDYLEKNSPTFCISFTDGYSDIDRIIKNYDISCPIFFVVPKGGYMESITTYGEVIEIELET